MMVIAQALIQRIKLETNKNAPESTSAMFVQKSINILKQITQDKDLMKKHGP